MRTSQAEKAITITARLYEARDFLRRHLTPENYAKRVSEYQGYIKSLMEKTGLDAMQSGIKLAKELESPFAQAAVFAAIVELYEP